MMKIHYIRISFPGVDFFLSDIYNVPFFLQILKAVSFLQWFLVLDSIFSLNYAEAASSPILLFATQVQPIYIKNGHYTAQENNLSGGKDLISKFGSWILSKSETLLTKSSTKKKKKLIARKKKNKSLPTPSNHCDSSLVLQMNYVSAKGHCCC